MDDRFLQKLLHFFTFGDYAGRNSKGSPWLFRKDFINTDRERSILKILVHDKKVTVKDLSTPLFTSEPSIRRDLVSLERQHLLKRIYGRAILDDNGELTDISEAEDYIRLHMMERSKKAYLLCNSSKFSTRCFHHLCHASELSGIISEGEVPEGLGEYFL